MAGPVRRSSVAPSALAPLLGCLLALAGAARATAQSAAVTFVEIPFGPSLMGDGVAQSAAGLGDVNGDGRGDFVLGFPQADTANGVGSGRVVVISGGDRSVLFTFEGDGPGDGFGLAVTAAGDVNGDGIGDVLVGAPYGDAPRYARVFSGSDGSTLWTFHKEGGGFDDYFGEFLAGGADFDADGNADLVVAQVGDFGGYVQVHSGATGALLHNIGPVAFFFGQGFVGTLRDINHDDRDELLIGTQGEASTFLSVLSGSDAHLIKGFLNVGDACDAGDLDGDGVHDLLVAIGDVISGATWTTLLQLPHGGTPQGLGDIDGDGIPDVALDRDAFSGADGTLLFSAGHTQDLVSVGDVDGDGLPDLLGRASNPVAEEATSPAGLFLRQNALVMPAESDVARAAFGAGVANAGDLNHDGYADIIVGSPGSASVRVLSGADGATLHEFFGVSHDDEFGSAVACAGDVDGDGVLDIVVGAPNELASGIPMGSVRVYSGATWHLLFGIRGSQPAGRFGQAVAAAGDVNLDGLADVAVGAPNESQPENLAGAVTVYAGPTGALLFKVPGPEALMQLGAAVACAGDLNGDGRDDLIAGAPGTPFGGTPKVGSALLLSGDGGAPLGSFLGVDAERSFGGSLAALGDLDDDGVTDFAVGARWLYQPFPFASFPYDRALVISGASGTRLFTWTVMASPNKDAPVVSGAGDVDGDGTPDVVIGLRTTNTTGFAEVRSGRDGTTLLTQSGLTGDGAGAAVAGGGDANGDGRADVIVGIPGDDAGGLDAGSIRVLGLSAVAPPWSFLGHALVGSEGLPLLVGSGTLQPSSAMSLQLSRAVAHARTALVIGFHALSLPFKGGTLVPFPDLVQWPILTTGVGTWELNAHWPVGAPPGMSVLFQSWIVDRGAVSGFAASNALQVETP